MKRTISVLVVLLLAASLAFAGGGKEPAAKITKLADLEGKVVAALSGPQDPEMIRALVAQQTGVMFKDMLFFDTYMAAIAALKSNKVDSVLVFGPMLNYNASRDASLGVINLSPVGTSTIHMAVRATDAELRSNINAALISMKNDGTLAKLEKEFVTDLKPSQQLAGKNMPRFNGAPTLVVGLSGDGAPVDYVAADGKPAGYNVELLALLAEKLNVNFEISVLPNESKFPALASNKIDIFFLHFVNSDAEVIMKTLETNSNATLTEPYYEFTEWGYLVLK